MQISIELASPQSGSLMPLLNAVISAASILVGIYLTSLFHERQQRAERNVALMRYKWESKVEHGEDLYSAVAKWRAQTRADAEYARRTYLGEKTYDGWVKYRESIASQDRVDSANIRMLVYVYFPSLEPSYVQIADSVEKIEEYQRTFREYRDAGALTRLGGWSKRLEEEDIKLTNNTSAFQEKLASLMRSLTSVNEIAPVPGRTIAGA